MPRDHRLWSSLALRLNGCDLGHPVTWQGRLCPTLSPVGLGGVCSAWVVFVLSEVIEVSKTKTAKGSDGDYRSLVVTEPGAPGPPLLPPSIAPQSASLVPKNPCSHCGPFSSLYQSY